MSRLNDLLRELHAKDPALAADIEVEVKALADRRAFGLNFERHIPETVELPGRPVRKGDKVRILPPRGGIPKKANEKLWQVIAIARDGDDRTAQLEAIDGDEAATASRDDLVVVAEFRDPIYPGLVSTGKVALGGDKPYHTVINAENYYALQTLLFAYRGKVDCIYIDPPYNTRSNQWKYNNDYVDPDDHYAHSKWLAFMERRLQLAHELLNPDASALIVTIDEKEALRLGLLLGQIFPDGTIQMVTSVISAKGAVRQGRGLFSRVEEHIFFVTFGEGRIHPWVTNMLPSYRKEDSASVRDDADDAVEQEATEPPTSIEWLGLRRREPSSVRGARPNQFFPVFVSTDSGTIDSIGDAIDDDMDRNTVEAPEGTVSFWPLKPDGTEMLWGLTPEALRKNWREGFVRVNSWKDDRQTGTVQYLPSGTIARVRSGSITVTGHASDGSVQGYVTPESSSTTPPKRVWNMRSHNAETGGTNLLSALIPKRPFDYPKSLYAVEDALRFVIGPNREAVVVDFFAGSGTTGHAVMRLNREDDGSRQAIVITNNEVSQKEGSHLRGAALRPGDAAWEARGICEQITKPRLEAAVTGMTPEGKVISSRYRFNDEFPIANGFEENVEFFTLTYEAPLRVQSNREFTKIAPLLWMRAGSRGRRIDDLSAGWDVADVYGVLADLDHTQPFIAALKANGDVGIAFIVTDEDRLFQAVVRELPDHVEPVRLYEAYLRNFEIETGRSSL